MVLFTPKLLHGDRSSCRHCLRAVKCLLSPLVAISRKRVPRLTDDPESSEIFCMSFNAARITSRGMHLSSHLSLVLYLLDPFLIFNGLMIKDFSVINNTTCQMPVRGEMMSESMFFFFLWHYNYYLRVTTYFYFHSLVTR